MRWNQKYSLKSYISGSLWLVPFVAVMLYWVVSRITHGIDGWLRRTGRIEATAFYGVSITGARALLETVVTLNLSFLVFTFGFAARGDSSGRRAIHPADHRDDTPA